MDIEVSQTTFGGFVFEPMTDAGRQWVQDVVERNPDYPVLQRPDGCMTGFNANAIGIEPCDFDAFCDDLTEAGLGSNIEKNGA